MAFDETWPLLIDTLRNVMRHFGDITERGGPSPRVIEEGEEDGDHLLLRKSIRATRRAGRYCFTRRFGVWGGNGDKEGGGGGVLAKLVCTFYYYTVPILCVFVFISLQLPFPGYCTTYYTHSETAEFV